MNKMKISLKTLNDCADFVSICNRFKSDINVAIYDDNNIIDGKSYLGVCTISLGALIDVQMISSDENEIVSFIRAIEKFRVV